MPVIRKSAAPLLFLPVYDRESRDVTVVVETPKGSQNKYKYDPFTGALRLNFNVGGGTLSSVSAYNKTKETITGDAYDFRPAANSIFMALLGVDLNQLRVVDRMGIDRVLQLSEWRGGVAEKGERLT